MTDPRLRIFYSAKENTRFAFEKDDSLIEKERKKKDLELKVLLAITSFSAG